MPDTAHSSTITTHPFIADPWWQRCDVCGLSQAAHRAVYGRVITQMLDERDGLPKRCPDCVVINNTVVCIHGGKDAQEEPSERS